MLWFSKKEVPVVPVKPIYRRFDVSIETPEAVWDCDMHERDFKDFVHAWEVFGDGRMCIKTLSSGKETWISIKLSEIKSIVGVAKDEPTEA